MENYNSYRRTAGSRRLYHSSRNPGRSRKNRNSKIRGVNLSLIIVIIFLAVVSGYITTKLFIYPLILGQPAVFETDFPEIVYGKKEDGTEIINESENVSEPTPEKNIISQIGNDVSQGAVETELDLSGYSIQYGAFTSEGAAEELVNELKESGLTAQIINDGKSFKVIGQIFDAKEEAVSARDLVLQYADEKYKDVFVTDLK